MDRQTDRKCMTVMLLFTCSDRECCCYGNLHSAGVKGCSLVTPCGVMVMGGGERGEVMVWKCDTGECEYYAVALTKLLTSLVHSFPQVTCCTPPLPPSHPLHSHPSPIIPHSISLLSPDLPPIIPSPSSHTHTDILTLHPPPTNLSSH